MNTTTTSDRGTILPRRLHRRNTRPRIVLAKCPTCLRPAVLHGHKVFCLKCSNAPLFAAGAGGAR